MNLEPIWSRITRKARGRKSCATVPLSLLERKEALNYDRVHQLNSSTHLRRDMFFSVVRYEVVLEIFCQPARKIMGSLASSSEEKICENTTPWGSTEVCRQGAPGVCVNLWGIYVWPQNSHILVVNVYLLSIFTPLKGQCHQKCVPFWPSDT